MKKSSVFNLIALVFLVNTSFAGTDIPVRELAPVKGLPLSKSLSPLAMKPTISSSKEGVKSLFFVDGHGQQHHMVLDPMGKTKGVIDTLKWHVGEPCGYNEYTGPSDTTFIWFYPVAQCSLLEIWGSFHDWQPPNTKISIPWLCYEERGDACADTCCPFWISVSEDESDTFAISLTDNLLPSALSWRVAGGDRWSKIDFTLYPVGWVLELPPDTAFVVILRAGIDGKPYINWDDCNGFTRETPAHWRFTCQHDTHASNYCSGVNCPSHYYVYYTTEPPVYPELLVMAVVSYRSVPPFIDSLTQVMHSYHLDGDFEVEAGMTDLDGEVIEATLSYTVRNSGDTTNLAMDIAPDPEIPTRFLGAATISGAFSFYDTIDYWVDCVDNEGRPGRWRGQGNPVKSFVLQEPNLRADIFLVNDWGGNRDTYYRGLLDSLGYEYECWDVTKSHGLDTTILGYGKWNTAIIFGWGCSTLPGRDYTGDMWANFLDQGTSDTTRNLLYVDQDYFCVHDDTADYPEGCGFEGDLNEGEFLYDYFGVGWAKSHPGVDDTLIGLDGQIVGKYVDSLFVINTWPDFTRANDQAVDIFFSICGNEPCGTRYDGGRFKTVFLPFPFEALCDYDTLTEGPNLTDKALTVMDSILAWFRTRDSIPSGVQEIPTGEALPKVFALSQNYPNPFNATTVIRYSLPVDRPSSSSTTLKDLDEGSSPARATSTIHVRLGVYNILGEKVATLVDERQAPGYKVVTWNVQGLASGIYLCRLRAGKYTAVRKMLLLK